MIASFGRVDLRSRDQVIDGAAVVVDLQADQRRPDRPEGCADQGAVVGAGPGLDRPLSRAEGVDAEDHVAQLGQADASGLNVGVHPSPGPVAVDREDARVGPADRVGPVQVRRDPDSRAGSGRSGARSRSRPALMTPRSSGSSGHGVSGIRPNDRHNRVAHRGQPAVPAVKGRRRGPDDPRRVPGAG